MSQLTTSPNPALIKPPQRATLNDRRKQVAFAGVGWIGRNRLEAVARTGLVDVAAIADPEARYVDAARSYAARASTHGSFEELLAQQPDGLVIATPSALHAEQAMAALQRGIAVFCQKPLGRNAAETARVVDAAREANLLLGVDFSYRHTCYQLLHDLVQNGSLGKINTIEMCFHNAYGPDKPWFYDPRLAGGGCVIDLGVHLVDLALWSLGHPPTRVVGSLLRAQGQPLPADGSKVEDQAMALLKTEEGCSLLLNCSWHLPAGQEAQIYINVYGTQGGASFRNCQGSFYDFETVRFEGTKSQTLFRGQDDWGGRAIVDWSRRLAEGSGFDPAVESVVQVAELLDQIYAKRD